MDRPAVGAVFDEDNLVSHAGLVRLTGQLVRLVTDPELRRRISLTAAAEL